MMTGREFPWDAFFLVGAISLVGLYLYFVPAIVAAWRNHHNTWAILFLNIFLGWTFVGWVLALVWALTATRRSAEGDEEWADEDAGYRQCPFCAEDIRVEATLCRYCGSIIEPVEPTMLSPL